MTLPRRKDNRTRREKIARNDERARETGASRLRGRGREIVRKRNGEEEGRGTAAAAQALNGRIAEEARGRGQEQRGRGLCRVIGESTRKRDISS